MCAKGFGLIDVDEAMEVRYQPPLEVVQSGVHVNLVLEHDAMHRLHALGNKCVATNV